MRPVDDSQCLVHVNICVNDRPEPKACCKANGGMEFFTEIKHRVKQRGLSGTHWVTRTGCLGFCNTEGTTVRIHVRGQEPRWYSHVSAGDLEAIWNEIVGALPLHREGSSFPRCEGSSAPRHCEAPKEPKQPSRPLTTE